jgi:transcriptional antiterminator NusG
MDKIYKWYCLRVVSNKERKIKERIEWEIDRDGLREKIPQVVVPSEKVYKVRNGKKVIQERTLTPGYLFIQAEPQVMANADMIQKIRDVKDVINFLGTDNPLPMKEEEVKRILSKVDESQEMGEALAEPFLVGEEVKVTEGSFENFVGTIQEVNEERKKLKVVIKIFSRGTEVELNFTQVEKLS